jgi:tetratricopeptide (TPR) repeat protein
LFCAKGDFAGAEPLCRRTLSIREKVLGLDHLDTIQSLFALAQLLRDRGDHDESAALYQRLLTDCETEFGRSGTPVPVLIQLMAISHNNLAFHSDVPARNWKDAEMHYRQSIELFQQLGDTVETANVELNLQRMYWLAGQAGGKTWAMVDEVRVKELTRILEEAGDKLAEKGHKLLKALSPGSD